jgi:hypothetical protein
MGFMKRIVAKMADVFRLPTADKLAQIELDEAKRSLLGAQTGLDYAKRMVDYHTDRIKRLTAYTKEDV